METLQQFLRNKRVFLTLTIISIVSSISYAQGDSKFSKTFFGPKNFEAEKDHEFSDGGTRVKRQSQSRPCPLPSINCNNIPNVNKFRTIDGTCNNLYISPYCGASNIAFDRWLPRTPPGGDFRCPSCPLPRKITSAMVQCPQHHTDNITLMVMQWGQFTDHDLVVTTEASDERCCQDFRTLTPTTEDCKPIDVRGDPFYGSLATTVNCLPFVRSRPAPCTGSSDRQTINELTSWLDGSMIYGSIDSVATSLRSFNGGRLRTGPMIEDLPCGVTPDICPRSFPPIRAGASGNDEFFAGDARIEEQPSLTSLHTLMIRCHNDIVSQLKGCIGDELKYQTGRKIVGAIVQHITFNEFLSVVLGPKVMNDVSLSYGKPLSLDATYSYNRSICTTAPNVFSTAAFRFGHSLLQDEFRLSNGNIIKLRESFNNNGVTRNDAAFPSHFLGGIIHQNARPMDQHIVEAVRSFLFAEGPSFAFGSDLYARNIQRGRDHGIPGYVKWQNLCVDNDPKRAIKSFDDLEKVMPKCVADQFKELYKYNSVFDIDLFPAGIAETEVEGGLVGTTFACIIAEFFSDIKYGDRFWFQNPGVFTADQVKSILRTKLSSLICLYTDVDEIQPYVMLPDTGDSGSNPLTSCKIILKDGVLNDINITSIWGNVC